MSSRVSIAAIAISAATLAACGDSPSSDSAQQDLQRDLQLASATTINLAGGRVDSSLLNSMETRPQAVRQPTTTVKKGAGSRAIRSETPTVMAEPDVEPAAVEESSEVMTESIAPTPEPTNEPVAVAPRPQPVIIQTGGTGDYGAGNSGGGVFGGGGGRGGVVIRGGGVDGDNCELHDRARRGGGTMRGPIYIPQPAYPRTGGSAVRPSGSGVITTRTRERASSGSGAQARPMTGISARRPIR